MMLLTDLGPMGLKDRIEKSGKESAARKKAFDDRLAIYYGRHKNLIQQRISETFERPDLKAKLTRFITTRSNLLKRATQAIAVAYDVPPTRELKGAAPEQQAEFLRAYSEAETALQAESWGRLAFVCNVVHVVPRCVGPEAQLEWVTVLPHRADVLFDKASGDRKPSILVYDADTNGARKVAIDSERFWWLNEQWDIVAEEEHYMGMTPWVTFRFSTPPEDDYWDTYNGQDLAEGTLDIGRILAQMAWTRKGHASDILYLWLKSPEADVPPGQVANGEAPIMGRGELEVGRVENIVAVDEFQKEISMIIADVSESYGIPSTLIDFQPQSTQDAANVFIPAGPRVHAQLAKLRNNQVKHHERSELELAVRVGALLRAHGRMAMTDDEVRESFRCRFAPLSYADHPKAQVETAQSLMNLGATDPYEFLQMMHPELTIEEAREEYLLHVGRRAEALDVLVTRNLPADSKSDGLTIAQIQGAFGKRKAMEMESESDPKESEEITYE